MNQLRVNARVELPNLACQGTIEHIDEVHVRVRWDDGKVGLLYFDQRMIPNAFRLHVIARVSEGRQ
jgi:hypothetical protein